MILEKAFGTSKTNFWKSFPCGKRVSDPEKASRKNEELEKLNSAQTLKRSKLTSFISNELKSRQLKFPLIGKFIDMAKAEPLHLKNNTVKERFMCLFRLVFPSQSCKVSNVTEKFQQNIFITKL